VRRSLEFSSVVTREGKWYVASCPELEIASQGKTVELALKNLGEAIELYLKDEDAKVIRSRTLDSPGPRLSVCRLEEPSS
jgi:predicted RNase H-like HicB family nuclease